MSYSIQISRYDYYLLGSEDNWS